MVAGCYSMRKMRLQEIGSARFRPLPQLTLRSASLAYTHDEPATPTPPLVPDADNPVSSLLKCVSVGVHSKTVTPRCDRKLRDL